MKTFKISIIAALALFIGISITSCADANEYADTDTNNPAWAGSHPQELTGTKWVRGTGIKLNAYGQEVQGFIESLDFVKEDSVIVKMSQGTTQGTWLDESNTEEVPMYEYTYSDKTGNIAIKKMKKDDKGNLTKTNIIIGVAVAGSITVVHYGDTPVQTYLVKQ